MIKFFRRIRKELLKENRFSKYMLYAIGEIILVVIGILIALQVNNWNTQRTEKETLYSILEAIKLDLETDIEQTKKANKFNQSYIDFRKRILMTKNFDAIPLDSLTLLMRKRTAIYTTNESAFYKLTNSGITKPFQNDSLNILLFKYYTIIKDFSDQKNDWERTSAYQEYETLVDLGNIEMEAKHYDMAEMDSIPTFQDSISQRENIIKTFTSIEVRNMLKAEVYRKINSIQFFEKRNKMALTLIREIDKELAHYKAPLISKK